MTMSLPILFHWFRGKKYCVCRNDMINECITDVLNTTKAGYEVKQYNPNDSNKDLRSSSYRLFRKLS